MTTPRLISVIGGTGAQGIPVVKALASSGLYTVRVLTRDPTNPRFKELQSYGPVEASIGTFASESALRTLFRGAWGAFVNIDGFNSGEKTEIFWTIRAWELAIEEGVQLFVLGNLDYAYKKSGFRPQFHAGHYDGKGRVGDFILAQNKDAEFRDQIKMRSALFTTGPYIEMTLGKATPFAPVVEGETAVWRVPLADGAVPFVALDDCGYYVKYLFDHPAEADGLNLAVALDHVTFTEYTKAFTAVTGHPARWDNVELAPFIELAFGSQVDTPAGYNADPTDPATMTLRQNFTAFFELWRHSGGNKGIITRDYEFLDRIHPGRIRSVEEWLRREEQKGLGDLWTRTKQLGHVLKVLEEGRAGTI
ncbi:hypothetical protein ONZ43_g4431 [Nemania bipapillata]|uniref:Uncharacterized protein n=1 Tax=Nemania bipapillata TaxID=110536 RepID=A0ACC2IMT8_9PEZI|nr:hypothetical protein ONZ43_g4431 [Nemania bipapillata]